MRFNTSTAMKIAEYIITVSYENGTPVSNLKLQKMLYFVQGEALKEHGEIAFQDTIEVWNYGPVVRIVYERYRHYGASPICKQYPTPAIIGEIKSVIDKIICRYGDQSAWDLVQETHRAGTPWRVAFDNKQQTISVRTMRDYFCG